MKTALITGGSSGIGYGLSLKFAEAGYSLLWVAKPEKEIAEAEEKILREYPTLEIHTLAIDLSAPEACKSVYKWASDIANVDVLMNNAGFGTYGYLNEISIEREMSMINLNIKAVYLLTRYFLNDMMKRNQGTIINISSNSSFETIPRLLTYSSTKAFVKHFSRGLNEELKMQGSDVKIITICPAAIKDTNFKSANGMDKVKTFDGLVATTVDEVVGDIWKAYESGKSFQISGRKMRWLYRINALIPFSLRMKLTADETSILK